MVYSDVIKNNWHLLLPKKEKYTKKDIKQILKKNLNVTEQVARFIVVCTSIFHESQCTDYINNYHSKEQQIKRMF